VGLLEEQVTALTREELLDIDPCFGWHDKGTARCLALRHAWNWAVEAEALRKADTMHRGTDAAAISQAWSAIAEALK
jgi:hypothetical protein